MLSRHVEALEQLAAITDDRQALVHIFQASGYGAALEPLVPVFELMAAAGFTRRKPLSEVEIQAIVRRVQEDWWTNPAPANGLYEEISAAVFEAQTRPPAERIPVQDRAVLLEALRQAAKDHAQWHLFQGQDQVVKIAGGCFTCTQLGEAREVAARVVVSRE